MVKEILKRTGERVYTIGLKEGGRGDICGHCHFPKEFIGKKFRIIELTKNQYNDVVNPISEANKRIKKRKDKLQKHLNKLKELRGRRLNLLS